MILPNIASISQHDEKWWRKHLGTSNVTIGTAGCLLCCSTIVCRFYGKDTWPDELNERMKEVGGYWDGNMWVWTALSKIYPDIGHKETINCYNSSAPLDKIRKRLDEGHPVIVMTFVGKITHYVLIFGYDDKGFYTCDPNKGDVVLFTDRFGDPARYIYKIDFYDGPLREENPPEESQEPDSCKGLREEISNLTSRLTASEETRKAIGETVEQMMKESERLKEIIKQNGVNSAKKDETIKNLDKTGKLCASMNVRQAETIIQLGIEIKQIREKAQQDHIEKGVNMKKVKIFLQSLLSRKFLFAVLAAFIAFGNAAWDWGLEASEVWQTILPLLAFIGVEGAADIKGR